MGDYGYKNVVKVSCGSFNVVLYLFIESDCSSRFFYMEFMFSLFDDNSKKMEKCSHISGM